MPGIAGIRYYLWLGSQDSGGGGGGAIVRLPVLASGNGGRGFSTQASRVLGFAPPFTHGGRLPLVDRDHPPCPRPSPPPVLATFWIGFGFR